MDIKRVTDASEALPVFLARFPGTFGVDWDDLVAAHDFGFLNPGEILAWIAPGTLDAPVVREMADIGVRGDEFFEAALWGACREVTGRLPRPGSLRWEMAQDRWRIALLREAMTRAAGNQKALGEMVLDIYEAVGCPEDMLFLWHNSDGPMANPAKIEAFVRRLEDRLFGGYGAIPSAG